MAVVRFSLFVATMIMVAHGFAGPGEIGSPAVAIRNLLWWQLATALFGGLVAGLSWRVLGRRAIAFAIAPTVLVGLELSAWLVSENLHHTLAGPMRALAFVACWAVPAVVFWYWGHRRPRMRWMTPVQAVLVLAAILSSFMTRPPANPPDERPDLALFVLDALQVRALGHLGAPLDPSPRIDALAARGWSSLAAFSAAATSVPGHAAILYGLDVAEHGAPTNAYDLPADLPDPLAQRLGERGYTTMGFCHNPLVSRRAGFARGFDVWWNWGEHGWLQSPVVVALLHWPAAYLWARASDFDPVTLTADVALPVARGPLFTFVQLLYTHDSYVDGDGWVNPERIAHLRELLARGEISNRTGYDESEIAGLHAAYLAAVAYSDRLVGEMIERLAARAGERGLVVVVTADHGETLAEHGNDAVSRHFGPWSTSLRVPIVVADTRVSTDGARGENLASNQRIQRLLLDAADGRLPVDVPRAWADHVENALSIDPAFIYSEPWLILVDDSLKVAIDREHLTDQPLAHRWRVDFEDQEPVTDSPVIGQRVDELLGRFETMQNRGLFKELKDMDPEKLEHLRALGYIE
jgi:hypothetical protein